MTKLATAAVALVTGFIVSGNAFALPAVQHSAIASHVGVGHGGRHHRWAHGSEVHAFNFPVTSPRDAASGQATGKRMHKPFTHAGPHH